MKQTKIGFCGPSGSGKTTLVKFLNDTYGIPWLNGSSGQVKTKVDNESLETSGLSVGKGHLEVIRTGHANPELAIANQNLILQRRHEMFKANKHFVTDRSPVDNWVYYLLQCSMYETDEQTAAFFGKCLAASKELTHIIFIPNMFEVENNGSRIPNRSFQMMVSGVFLQGFNDIQNMLSAEGKSPKFLQIQTKNLALRKDVIKDFLER